MSQVDPGESKADLKDSQLLFNSSGVKREELGTFLVMRNVGLGRETFR